MDSLLFLVSPIWWNTETILSSLIIASTIAMTVIVYRFIRAIKPSIQNQEEDFVFTAEEDADWEEKTLTRLKTHLMQYYSPAHTPAHTAEEICQYVTHPEMIATLTRLEHAEYSKEKITREERNTINTTIASILPVLKKPSR